MKLRIILSGAVLLLLTAIGLVVYGSTRPVERTFHGKLIELLPSAPAGWTRTLRPIADTPEMQKAVGEILNFDDGVFVDYTRGADRLSVYIAYWTPGKMSHRLVAGHTPDVCWVGAGWVCTERSTASPQVSGLLLHPAETRTFTAQGTTEYVWFWHLVGGQPKSYGTGAKPPWHASLQDMLKKGLNQREEQFFIRLSSAQPLDSPALAPVFETVLRTLPVVSER
jgi:hypothetical protein